MDASGTSPSSRSTDSVATENSDTGKYSCFMIRLVIALVAFVIIPTIQYGKTSMSHTYTRSSYTPSNNYDYKHVSLFGEDDAWDKNPENWCTTSVCKEAAKEILSSLNASADPCDNFYNFACQGWQANNPRPEWADEWSVFSKLREKTNKVVIDTLIEESKSSDIQALALARQYYRTCMSATSTDNATNNKTLDIILEMLEKYGGWPILYEDGSWDSDRFDWMKSIVALQRELDTPTIFEVFIYQPTFTSWLENEIMIRDPIKNKNLLAVSSENAGSSLAFLFSFKDFIVNISRELLEHSGRTNIDQTYLEKTAYAVIGIELEFGAIRKEPSLLFDASGLPKELECTVAELQTLLNDRVHISMQPVNVLQLLNLFFENTGIRLYPSQQVDVDAPYFLNAIERITILSKEDLANYLHFKMAMTMMKQSGSKTFENYFQEFQQGLIGTTKKPPREQICVNLAKKKFPHALGYVYVKKHNKIYDQNRFTQINQMFGGLRRSFREIISESSYRFLNATILNALLRDTKLCVGYPSWIYTRSTVQSKYLGLNFTTTGEKSNNFLQQTMDLNSWTMDNELKELNKKAPRNGCKWSEFPGNVEAFNKLLSVYIPLGIIQLPFYNKDLPRSLRYGQFGGILGHEIAHSLIGKGVQNTVVTNCVINQYNEYVPEELTGLNITVDGNLTLNENLADNAGLQAAYISYQNSYDNYKRADKMPGLEMYSNDQLFYIGFAQNFCESTTKEGLKYSMDTDEHSPGVFRVLGTLQNSPEFAKAWKCGKGTKMNPGTGRCKLF